MVPNIYQKSTMASKSNQFLVMLYIHRLIPVKCQLMLCSELKTRMSILLEIDIKDTGLLKLYKVTDRGEKNQNKIQYDLGSRELPPVRENYVVCIDNGKRRSHTAVVSWDLYAYIKLLPKTDSYYKKIWETSAKSRKATVKEYWVGWFAQKVSDKIKEG